MRRIAEKAQADKQRRNSRAAAEETGAVAKPPDGPVPIEEAAAKPTESDLDETQVSHRSEGQRVSYHSGTPEDSDEPRASHRSEGQSSARVSHRSGTQEGGKSPQFARTPTHESDGRTPSRQSATAEKVLKSLPTQKTFLLTQGYVTIESLDCGELIIAQRKKLLDAVPDLQPKVDFLIRRAEKEFNFGSQTIIEEAMKSIAQASSIADRAKSLATKIGVPPDHPDFPRVVQIEEKLDRYMSEAARLQKLSQSYNTEIQRWRTQVEELSSQRPALLGSFKHAKRENQLFQAIGPSEPSSSSRAAGAHGGSLKPLAKLPKGSAHDVRTWTAPVASDASGGAPTAGVLSGVRAQLGLLQDQAPNSAREPRGALQRLTKSNISSSLPATMPPVLKKKGSTEARDATFSPSSSSGLSSTKTLLPTVELEQEQDASVPLRSLGLTEAHYLHIRQLEAKVKNAKQEVRKLTDAQCKGIVRTGWLEEFFLLCMDDVRKEFHRRKHHGAAKLAASRPTARDTFGGHLPQRSDSDLSSRISCGSSKSAPRIDVLEMLLAAEDLSSFLFEKIFPHRGAFYSIKRRDGGPSVTGGVSVPPASGVASTAPLPPLPSFKTPPPNLPRHRSLKQ